MIRRHWMLGSLNDGFLALLSLAALAGCADDVNLGQRYMDTGLERDSGTPDSGGIDAEVLDAGACDESPCRLVSPQCGCGDTLACQRILPMSVTRSCVTPGAVREGQTCSTNRDCATGLSCLVFGGPPGVCERWCNASSQCPSSPCLRIDPFDGNGLCASGCNVLDGSGCPSPKTCHLSFGISVEGTEPLAIQFCAPATGAVEDQSCVRDGLDCGGGLFCEPDRCRPLCELPGGSCSSGTCLPIDPPVDSIGYCA